VWPLIKPKRSHVAAMTIFLLLFLISLYLVTKNTEAYEAAENFVATDARVAAAIGPVKRTDFKFWNGFEFTGSDANFSIGAVADKGEFVIEVRLHCLSGTWQVEEADIRARDGTQTRIPASLTSGSGAAH
jgi:hypothetical protein